MAQGLDYVSERGSILDEGLAKPQTPPDCSAGQPEDKNANNQGYTTLNLAGRFQESWLLCGRATPHYGYGFRHIEAGGHDQPPQWPWSWGAFNWSQAKSLNYGSAVKLQNGTNVPDVNVQVPQVQHRVWVTIEAYSNSDPGVPCALPYPRYLFKVYNTEPPKPGKAISSQALIVTTFVLRQGTATGVAHPDFLYSLETCPGA